MSREIKFRAAVKATGRIYEVASISFEYKEVRLRRDSIWALDRLELMQFTGLTDRNGKEIYEGDVVRYHYMTEGMSVVKYSDHYPSYEPFNQLQHSVWETIEVIGNIYENPDLLKEAA